MKLSQLVPAALKGDSERLARRREIKKELAARQARAGRHRAIGDQIRALNQRAESADAEYQKTCQPIQAQREKIESEFADAILNGVPISNRLAKQLADVQEKLATANAKLEGELDVLKKLRRQAEAERKTLSVEVDQIGPTRSKLTAVGVADPELLLQKFSATEARHWAQKRVSAANNELQQAQTNLSLQQQEREAQRGVNSHGEVYHEPEVTPHEQQLEREVDQWLAEVTAAEQAMADSVAALDKIRQAIIDE